MPLASVRNRPHYDYNLKLIARLRGNIMSNTSQETSRITTVSYKTALDCLDRICVLTGMNPGIRTSPARTAVEGEVVPVSRLIDVAAERGLQANLVRLDWQGLQAAVDSDPLLVLLRNAHVVAVVSNGFHGPDEIVVSDPLNGGGELIYLPRSELERGWDGDTLIVAPQPIKRARSFLWVTYLLCVGAVLSAVVLLLPREIHLRVATSDPPAREASAVTARET